MADQSMSPAREPFDPSRVSVPPAERSQASTLSPRQVNELVRGAVLRHLPPNLQVVGEIGDLSRPASGHLYFSLRDDSSELRCVMWRSAAQRVRFRPEPGLQIVVSGSLEVYVPRGSYQLVARTIEPVGVGALELALRQLRERLQKEGLLDPARKRPLPRFPQRIVLITSPRGAAVRDMIQTIARRYAAVEVLLFPVRVQGDGAAEEIARALEWVNSNAAALGGVDALIVGRGGGSAEDLWAFNEERVARAIAASLVPVVSAVGHEVDITLADLVADVRAATPTAAAELVTPNRQDLLAAVAAESRRALLIMTSQLRLAREQYRAIELADPLARPMRMVRDRQQMVDELIGRAQEMIRARVSAAASQQEQAAQRLLRSGAPRAVSLAAQRVEILAGRLRAALAARPIVLRGELSARGERLLLASPWRGLARLDERFHQTLLRLRRAADVRLIRAAERLRSSAHTLEACNPRSVLQRGYSITRLARTRAALRSISSIQEGQMLEIELSDGTFKATARDPRQPGLFDDV